MSSSLSDIVSFFNQLLNIPSTPDYSGAMNGLQLENSGEIHSVVTAVDASERAIQEAINLHAQLLIVHHGLFWSGMQMIAGPFYRKLKLAMDHDLAIYSAHLPLDIHPEIGNNALLARELGLFSLTPVMPWKGINLGLCGQSHGSLADLIERLGKAVEAPVQAFLRNGPEASPGQVFVCTGGAGNELADAVAQGADTLVTGEGSHWTIPMAEELGVNLIYAGHYETETFGVRALGELATEQWGLPCTHLNLPPQVYSAS
jgi:dinuclear metal center YbgI/SA1388 family protein